MPLVLGGKVTAYRYGETGLKSKIITSGGVKETRDYDEDGNMVLATDVMGGLHAYEYDSDGMEIKHTYNGALISEKVYDERKNLVRTFNGFRVFNGVKAFSGRKHDGAEYEYIHSDDGFTVKENGQGILFIPDFRTIGE